MDELLQSKHGVIIVGEANAGKSTVVELLEAALNKSSANEFALLVEERKREKLEEIDEEELEELYRTYLPL